MEATFYRYTVLVLLLCLLTTGGVQSEDIPADNSIRMLLVGDPFALAFQNTRNELETLSGKSIQLEIVAYTDVLHLLNLNARDIISSYDIVSFDVVWTGRLIQNNVLLDLTDLILASSILRPQEFLMSGYRASIYEGRQWGLPVQPHPELLWYRADLFEAAGLLLPETTDDVIAAAQALTDPSINQYGICWNGQRGQALGQQMSHFYAAFGQPLLNDSGFPSLNTDAALRAAEYALTLKVWSPPDILSMSWDQRILRFRQGGCAMTYAWSARTYLVENTAQSSIAGKIGYTGAPHAPGVTPVTPIGTWSLGIPANIGAREQIAWEFLEWLSSEDIQYLLAQNGNGGIPRAAWLQDDSLQALYPSFSTTYYLHLTFELQDWMRPPVPQWHQLENLLGTVYHDMLRGEITAQEAVSMVQQRAERIFINP